MKRFELLVPPPLVMLLTGLLMWALSEIFPALTLPSLRSAVGGSVIGLIGVAISLAGMITFKRVGTTLDPQRLADTTALIRSGVYRFSRNPMYLGVLFMLIGWAVYLGHLLSVLCILAFVAYITRYQIVPEERLLQEKFGGEFQAYKRRARRWL